MYTVDEINAITDNDDLFYERADEYISNRIKESKDEMQKLRDIDAELIEAHDNLIKVLYKYRANQNSIEDYLKNGLLGYISGDFWSIFHTITNERCEDIAQKLNNY